MSKVLAAAVAQPAATQAEATSLVDEAYQALKTAIRDNVFPPGHQAAEPEIARQLGMSRTPVHEAIIRLQEEGLVQVLPRRGILICPISADDMREIYDVLIAVEGMAAALLAGLPETLAASAADALEQETAAMEQALGERRAAGLGRRRRALPPAPDRALRQPAAGPHRGHGAGPVPPRAALHAAPEAAAARLGRRAPASRTPSVGRTRRGRGRSQGPPDTARDAFCRCSRSTACAISTAEMRTVDTADVASCCGSASSLDVRTPRVRSRIDREEDHDFASGTRRGEARQRSRSAWWAH